MKKLLLIIPLILTVNCFSQNLKIGFSLEFHQIRINSGTGILGGNGAPLSIHIAGDYKFTRNFSTLVKIGRTLHLEFLGWEFGIHGKYQLYKPLFIFGGTKLHLNEGRGISNEEWVNYANIFMLNAGVGADITSILSVDLSYYYPLSKKIIGGSRNYYSGKEEIITRKFNGMIRLGFAFKWEI